MKPKKASGYPGEVVQLCESVLLEVFSILGQYKEHFAVVGGKVPRYLIDQRAENAPGHVGTMDVDLAVNLAAITLDTYNGIADRLNQRGYRYRKDRDGNDLQFSFEKVFDLEGEAVTIHLDLLGPEYEGPTRGFRQRVEPGVHAHTARGCDLVFRGVVPIRVKGKLPDGIPYDEEIPVAGIIPFLVMKTFAFADRKEEKDAADIYYCVKHYPDGMNALADEFQHWLPHGLVTEALDLLNNLFAERERLGPQRAATFLEEEVPDRESLVTDIWGTVGELFRLLESR